MQLYAITNSLSLATSFPRRVEILKRLAGEWAEGGVDYVQVREKDLSSGELEFLVGTLLVQVRGSKTRILVNGRPDVGLAAGADGVHLPGRDVSLFLEVRRLFASLKRPELLLSVACHSLQEARARKIDGADMILFAPVFEKLIPGGRIPGAGLKALEEVCQVASPLPVLALGGIDGGNASSCVQAGAQGVAAIRMFCTGEWKQLSRD